jgi:hypothetical protein
MAIDLNCRPLPWAESGHAMNLFALIFGNQLRVKIEYFSLTLDQYRKRIRRIRAVDWP